MKKKTNIFGTGGPLSIDSVDIPIIVVLGAAIGFLISGLIQMVMGSLLDAGDGAIWSIKAIVAGMLSIVISMLIAFFGWLYWFVIFNRSRSIWPRFSGFGLVLGLMSLVSAVMLSAELYAHFLYKV